MAHWINNLKYLPLLCRNLELYIVQLCLTAGREAGKQNTEIQVNFETLKFTID